MTAQLILRGRAERHIADRFPYLVWYTVHDDVGIVRVLAITHQRREPHERARHVAT